MATANSNFVATPLAVQAPEGTRRLLRFTTAGSVDDGKSTLIGRLLYDSQAVYEDQLSLVRKSRINRANGPIDFSLLTDGLRAEREQGITIDVAYRYFSTPRRKFIIADTPGHEQYTRNMVTGASTADAAVVLIDATKGLLPQSRRHSYISSLLGIRYIVAAVNKMDLVAYSEIVFRKIEADLHVLAEKLGLSSVYVLPISALEGDNIVHRSRTMSWFTGPTLLHYLEELETEEAQEQQPFRFPVQYVIRPDASFRGFAGQVESGSVSVGDVVSVFPSGVQATIKSLESYEGSRDEARAGEPVTITFQEEVDVSRGDLIYSGDHPPAIAKNFHANLVWMTSDALDRNKLYILKHTTRSVRARVTTLKNCVDVNTLSNRAATTLRLNDIGLVELSTTLPIFFDPYVRNRAMGSFILIDPVTNATVAAGMIRSAVADSRANNKGRVTAEERIARHGHAPAVIQFRGGAHSADGLERALFDDGWHVYLANSDDFSEEQLSTLLTVLQTTGALVLLLGARDITPAIRRIFNDAVFVFEAGNGSPDAELTDHIMDTLSRWRSASAKSTGDLS